jgi:hypothetical protein
MREQFILPLLIVAIISFQAGVLGMTAKAMYRKIKAYPKDAIIKCLLAERCLGIEAFIKQLEIYNIMDMQERRNGVVDKRRKLEAKAVQTSWDDERYLETLRRINTLDGKAMKYDEKIGAELLRLKICTGGDDEDDLNGLTPEEAFLKQEADYYDVDGGIL